MVARSFWKGYLKLSLVTCPVAMMPATTEGQAVRFRTLNGATGNPVSSHYVDADTGDAVDDSDEVKGYPTGPDEYVMLEDDEIDAVALESTRTIDIDRFVPRDSIGWVWYDKAHYLTPNDKVGEEAFSVIREAMAATDTVGISRVVLYRRERAVLLEPRDKGIVLWTLRYGDEVRDPEPYFTGVGKGKPEPKLLDMMTRLIEDRSKPWSPDMVTDPVQNQLLEIIDTKKKGRKPAKSKAKDAPRGDNVVDIMEALKRSLASESKKT
jgi:DNA end-binding protein Ku